MAGDFQQGTFRAAAESWTRLAKRHCGCRDIRAMPSRHGTHEFIVRRGLYFIRAGAEADTMAQVDGISAHVEKKGRVKWAKKTFRSLSFRGKNLECPGGGRWEFRAERALGGTPGRAGPTIPGGRQIRTRAFRARILKQDSGPSFWVGVAAMLLDFCVSVP